MRRLLNGLRNAAFFLLCYAQVPMLAGHFLLSDPLPLLLVQMALLPVSFLISLVPGHVGGGAKNGFLNRLTEEATGKQVIALPIEATALGNLKIQMEVK